MAIDALAQDIIWHTPRRRVRAVGSAADPYWTDTNSYVGLWEMETTNATATLDTSGNSYNVSNRPNVATGPAWTIVGTNSQGRVEHAYSFDGAAGYFRGADIIMNGATALTMCAWVKWMGPTAYGGIIGEYKSGYDGFWGLLSIGAAGDAPRADVGTASAYIFASATDKFPSNQWCFVWFRWKANSTIELYTNNVKIAESAGSTISAIVSDTPLTVGFASYANSYWEGSIDNPFAILSYKSVADMMNIYSNTCPTNNMRKRP